MTSNNATRLALLLVLSASGCIIVSSEDESGTTTSSEGSDTGTGTGNGSGDSDDGVDDTADDTGADAEPTCEAEGLRALVLPVDPTDPSSETFTYYYQWLERGGGAGPTVLHIPGGPGMPSIGSPPEGLPANVDLVLTDPRGDGCNAAAAPHDASF